MSVTPPSQSFQYLQGWPPAQSSNILSNTCRKGRQYSISILRGRQNNLSTNPYVNGSYTRVTKRSLLDVTRRGTLLLPHSLEWRSEALGAHSPPAVLCAAEMPCWEAQTSRREAVPQNVTSAVADSSPTSGSQIGVEQTWQVHGTSRCDSQTLALALA